MMRDPQPFQGGGILLVQWLTPAPVGTPMDAANHVGWYGEHKIRNPDGSLSTGPVDFDSAIMVPRGDPRNSVDLLERQIPGTYGAAHREANHLGVTNLTWEVNNVQGGSTRSCAGWCGTRAGRSSRRTRRGTSESSASARR